MGTSLDDGRDGRVSTRFSFFTTGSGDNAIVVNACFDDVEVDDDRFNINGGDVSTTLVAAIEVVVAVLATTLISLVPSLSVSDTNGAVMTLDDSDAADDGGTGIGDDGVLLLSLSL